MKNVLVLLSASFPFGRGETFLAAEAPWLEEAFDELVVISNDTTSPPTHALADRVTTLRIPYALSRAEKVTSLLGLLSPTVWRELGRVRRRGRVPVGRRVLATVLVSWRKAHKVGHRLRALARARPGARVHAYSYWANDMAVAAALARRRGWVDRAWARAHGWDVYPERSGVGFLPFRDFLARSLDHLFFVSEDGRRAFQALTGRGDLPSLEVLRLGTAEPPATAVARQEPLTVVSCSALVPIKRVDRLARALELLERPVRWIHLGDGPTRPEIESIVRGLPARVHAELRGHVPHEAVLATWAELHPTALVNVSDGEGVPVAMMEAMSMGIPVVAPRVGGVPEIVRDGVNGVLLEPEPSPGAVAGAVARIADLPAETFTALSRAATATWRERYRAEANYRRLVERVLASPQPAEEGAVAG